MVLKYLIQYRLDKVFFVNTLCLLCFCGSKKLATKSLILKDSQKASEMFQLCRFLTKRQ